LNWYIEGTLVNLIFATDQSRHRAFTHDNIDPTKTEFVAGSSQKEIETQKFFFEPIGSGLVNRDFKDVVPGEKFRMKIPYALEKTIKIVAEVDRGALLTTQFMKDDTR
jgi:hypothetical protein